MDDIRTILDQLDGNRLEFVYARSRTSTAAEALRESGVKKSTYYSWGEEDRQQLDDYADLIRRNRILLAEPKLNDAIEEAVDTLLELMRGADKDSVRLAAAKEVLNRVMGTPRETVNMDVTSGGETLGRGMIDNMAEVFVAMRDYEENTRDEN